MVTKLEAVKIHHGHKVPPGALGVLVRILIETFICTPVMFFETSSTQLFVVCGLD